MSKWFNEFKVFALRGNMVDLAIGVVIGAAFGKVVNSFVSDIIMPPIGLLIGGVNFSTLALKLNIPGSIKPPVEIKYGLFINQLLDFIIIALAIFFVIKLMNRLYKKKKEDPTTKECDECLMTIPLKAKKCHHCCSNV